MRYFWKNFLLLLQTMVNILFFYELIHLKNFNVIGALWVVLLFMCTCLVDWYYAEEIDKEDK